MKKILVIGIVVILLLFILIYYWQRLYIIQSRANIVIVDYDNIYSFCTPSRAKANCQEIIRCSFVVLDTKGLPVENKSCSLGSQNLNVDIIRGISDTKGTCIFDVAACSKGNYQLQGYVDNKPLPNKISVFFD